MAPRIDSNKTRVSASSRAGLKLPVARVSRTLRDRRYTKRVSPASSVYLTAVAEYLVAEVFELAGNAAKDAKRVRILPRHIQLAIRNDEELNQLFGNVTIAQAGVVPLIHHVVNSK